MVTKELESKPFHGGISLMNHICETVQLTRATSDCDEDDHLVASQERSLKQSLADEICYASPRDDLITIVPVAEDEGSRAC